MAQAACLPGGGGRVGGRVELQGGDGEDEGGGDGEQGAAEQGEADDYGYADDGDGDPLEEQQRWAVLRPWGRRLLGRAPFPPLAGVG